MTSPGPQRGLAAPTIAAIRVNASSSTSSEVAKLIAPARLVLGSLVDRLTDYARLCHSLEIPLVYIAEYTYETRRRIIESETESTMRRWRRHVYNRRTERRYRDAVRRAHGVQCNGTPTFEAYRELNAKPLLYFDTRVRGEMLAAPETVRRRLMELIELAGVGNFLIQFHFGNMKPELARNSMRLFASEVMPHLRAESAELFARDYPNLDEVMETA